LKKVLAILLCASMIAVIIPAGALASFAEGTHSNHTLCGQLESSNTTQCNVHTESAGEYQHGEILEWTEWESDNALPTDAGNYYLTENVTLSATWEITTDITLCLNGKTIALENGSTGSVIAVNSGAKFTLCDCEGGGKITGGNTTNGGGILVTSGNVVMYGGTIADNKATVHGGGIYITSGNVVMYGGNITGNKALKDATGANTDRNKGKGGGVYAPSASAFVMYGGNITGNYAKDASYAAVYPNNFNMYGGTTGGMWGGVDWTFVVTKADGKGTLTISVTQTPLNERDINKWKNSNGDANQPYEDGYWKENVHYLPFEIETTPYVATKVNKLIIEEGVINIGSFVAQKMPLEDDGEVVIPASVEYIGQEAFQNSAITKLTFASNSKLKCLDSGALKNLSITSLTLPASLQCIHRWCLNNCKQLEHIEFLSTSLDANKCKGHQLDYYGYYQSGIVSSSETTFFSYCDELKTITFQNKEVRNILLTGGLLKSIIKPPANSNELVVYTIEGLIDEALANGQNTAVLKYSTTIDNHSGGEKIEIPDGFTLIIPSGVTLTNSSQLTVLGDIEIQDGGKLQNSGTLYSVDSATKLNDEKNNSEKYSGSGDSKPCYTITFDTDGGTDIAPITQGVGTAVTAPENPTKEGYTFVRWDEAIPATMPAENITRTAVWEINEYTITFDTDGGTDIDPITQDFGTAITAPENPTKTYYTFIGWDIEIPSTMPAENITITALWKANDYSITFDTDGGSAVAPITQGYGSAVTAPADPVKEGYTFAGWDTEIPETMPGENVEIKALWTVNQYKITFDTDGGNAIAPITQDFGTAITAPDAPTKVGYTFIGWDVEIPSIMPAENITVTALWKINQYTITFEIGADSENTCITLDYGTVITVAPGIPYRTHYTFVGWDKDIPETMPAENITITAVWKINEYTITFDTDGGSTIAPITQGYGSAVTVPDAPTKVGYTFIGWDVEIPETIPAENITVKALWKINQYTITFETADGTAIESITQDFGTSVTAPSVPTRKGYLFDGWDKEIPATMPGEDITVTALWTAYEYTVSDSIDAIRNDGWDAFAEKFIEDYYGGGILSPVEIFDTTLYKRHFRNNVAEELFETRILIPMEFLAYFGVDECYLQILITCDNNVFNTSDSDHTATITISVSFVS